MSGLRFALDPALEPIHQPVRLQLMALLFRERDVGFAQARDLLGVTDGNLGSHAKVLEGLGYLESRRVLVRGGFQFRYQVTEAGSAAFQAYLAALNAFLGAVGTAQHGLARA